MRRKGNFISVGKFSTDVENQVPKGLIEYFMANVTEIDIVSQYVYSVIDIRRTLDDSLFDAIKYAAATIYTIGRKHGEKES